jgi:protein phosphatase
MSSPVHSPDDSMVVSAQATHIGAEDSRTNLEDYAEATVLRLADGALLHVGMVADGMGGVEGGEIASQTAVSAALAALRNQSQDALPGAIGDALTTAQEEVLRRRKELRFERMGTTGTLAAITFDNRLFLGHVGDSRAYLVRNNGIQQITVDHSWGAEQVRAGLLTPGEARQHERRDALVRYLGNPRGVEIDLGLWLHGTRTAEQAQSNQGLQLYPGDAVVLCTDGLIRQRPGTNSHFVEADEIVQIASVLPPNEAVRKLIDLALERSADDNVSVVVMAIAAETQPAPATPDDATRAPDGTLSVHDVEKALAGQRPAARPDADHLVMPTTEKGVMARTRIPVPDRVIRQPGRTRQRALTAAVVAVIALVVIALGYVLLRLIITGDDAFMPSGPVARIEAVEGGVGAVVGGEEQVVGPDTRIRVDQHVIITTGSEGRAVVALPGDRATVFVGRSTELWLDPSSREGIGIEVSLRSGTVVISIEQVASGRLFPVFSTSEVPRAEGNGALIGIARQVDEAGGQFIVECLQGDCVFSTAAARQQMAVCQRAWIVNGEEQPAAAASGRAWVGALIYDEMGVSFMCP